MKTSNAKPEQPAAEPVAVSLRDEIAMRSVTGCLSSGRHFDKKELAAEAYEFADIMVAASKKEPK